MKISVYGETNVGRQRDHNEDSFGIFCHCNTTGFELNDQQIELAQQEAILFMVADGMGGANAGEIASSIAVQKVGSRFKTHKDALKDTGQIQKFLFSVIADAHSAILKKARNDESLKGMGTTIILGYITGHSLYLAWAGDSRIYHFNTSWGVSLRPFSDDHSLVWSKVRKGEMTPEEARNSSESNLILNAVGDPLQKPAPDFKSVILQTGDRLVMCSDGMNSMLSDSGIQQLIEFSSSTKETCKSLIKAACNAGGRDNVTVIVVDILDAPKPTKEVVTRKQKNRRRIWPFFVILLLVMLVYAGTRYNIEIRNFITEKVKPFLTQLIHPGSSLLPVNDSLSATVNTDNIVAGFDRSPKDTNRIKTDLEFEFYRIRHLTDQLETYMSEHEEAGISPADQASFDKLFVRLDSLRNLVANVADTSGNGILSLNKPGKALKMLEPLKNSVDRLKITGDKLMNHPK
ncbi:MAG TPA: protein phosphatase 2C domain-containing protein [Bacteroidales bacterium]|nr:protein phosphatase 2C domain-containing protein [Bacteroidales bacterium]